MRPTMVALGVVAAALSWRGSADAAAPGDALAADAAPSSKVPELWLYLSTNLLVDENVAKAQALLQRAARAGYARVVLADVKLSRLDEVGERYVANVRRLLSTAREAKVRVVPAIFPIGYSEGLLHHDPNLAEALPARGVRFVVADGAARVDAQAQALLKPEWKDDCWREEAPGAWRCTAPNGNARVVFRVKVRPWHPYHLALSVETRDFEGEPRAQALVGDRALIHSNLGAARTQPPTRHHAVFNSFEHEELLIYLGAWGAGGGELAIRDATLEVAGLVNLVRRDGAPFEVRDAKGRLLAEGRDYQPVSDPRMGVTPWKGSFDVWHEPPAIATRLPDGAALDVSFHHVVTVHDGQVMICPSEPATLELLKREVHDVAELFGREAFFLSHDEIRVLNQDEACRRRGLDAGALLADHVAACSALVRKEAPRAEQWIWSDMFDPNHNAHAGYYLVRGDLAGSWEGLPKEVGIAAWYFEQRAQSLPFFAERGHPLLIAGYYDGPVEAIDAWLAAGRAAGGVAAVMYTTWQQRYDDLEAFAQRVRAAK